MLPRPCLCSLANIFILKGNYLFILNKVVFCRSHQSELQHTTGTVSRNWFMREEPAAWHFKDSFLSNDLLSLTESKRVGEVKTCLSAALLKKQFFPKQIHWTINLCLSRSPCQPPPSQTAIFKKLQSLVYNLPHIYLNEYVTYRWVN